jgi:hypothetical protein
LFFFTFVESNVQSEIRKGPYNQCWIIKIVRLCISKLLEYPRNIRIIIDLLQFNVRRTRSSPIIHSAFHLLQALARKCKIVDFERGTERMLVIAIFVISLLIYLIAKVGNKSELVVQRAVADLSVRRGPIERGVKRKRMEIVRAIKLLAMLLVRLRGPEILGPARHLVVTWSSRARVIERAQTDD